jgi:hypothetical protein
MFNFSFLFSYFGDATKICVFLLIHMLFSEQEITDTEMKTCLWIQRLLFV